MPAAPLDDGALVVPWPLGRVAVDAELLDDLSPLPHPAAATSATATTPASLSAPLPDCLLRWGARHSGVGRDVTGDRWDPADGAVERFVPIATAAGRAG